MNSETSGARRVYLLTLAVLLAAGLLLPLPALAQLQGGQTFSAQLTATGLEVTGATPGGEVAVFGAWRQRQVYWSEVGRVDERVVDNDGDGVVSWDMGRAVPTATVLFAVDLTSGEWASTAPIIFGLRPMPQGEWQVSTDGSTLAVLSKRLELFWVRPGVGTWSRTAMGGGSLDDPLSQGGSLVVSIPEIANGAGQGASSPPQHLALGDVLVGVDLQSLEYFAHEMTGGGA